MVVPEWPLHGGKLFTEAVAGSGGGVGLVFETRRPRLGLGWKDREVKRPRCSYSGGVWVRKVFAHVKVNSGGGSGGQ